MTPNYEQFIYANYPAGSFDTRPLNFSNKAETLSVRKYLLDKIFQTFPQRKFILVGDVSNSDIMRDYPQMVTDYPGQVQCIFLRNTTSTDPTDKFPYDTSGFKDVNQQQYMFFVVPDDLKNLDIANGHCYNQSVAQNLTFGYQNLPLGLSSNAQSSAGNSDTKHSAGVLQLGLDIEGTVWYVGSLDGNATPMNAGSRQASFTTGLPVVLVHGKCTNYVFAHR